MKATASLLATMLILGWMLPATAAHADQGAVRQASLAQNQPPSQGQQPSQAKPSGGHADIDVNVGSDGAGNTVWYTSPLWITIGVIAALVVILIIALAARGGGTTVIREERR